eukprot:4212598-Amphidinium_carterae.2
MDVDGIKGSWNRGKGKDKGKGKESGEKGKKGNKGSGGKASEKGNPGTGNRQGGTSSTFQGECGYCGKWGHKRADCRKRLAALGGAGTKGQGQAAQ